jgi:hypothetical protein
MFQSARSNSNELDHFDYFIDRSETQTECESYFIQTENEEYYQPVLMPDGSYFQSISSDITTSGNQTLVCTAALTVTLNASPKDGELVRIKRVSGQTIIDGNSRSIDGDSTYTMLVDYEGVQVVYSALDDEWFKI